MCDIFTSSIIAKIFELAIIILLRICCGYSKFERFLNKFLLLQELTVKRCQFLLF